MRTTITINDDLMSRLKKKAFESGKPLKEIMENALRVGLEVSDKPKKKYSCPEFSLGEPLQYDLDRALFLSQVLEDEEIARKIHLKK